MADKKSVANKKVITKGKPHRFPKGVSGNPAGRPKTGQSWGEIAKEIGDQYPEEVVTLFGVNTIMGKAFSTFPKGVQIKYSVFYRVIIALMNEPTPGLLKELLDRIEGKVVNPVDLTTNGEKIKSINLIWNADGSTTEDNSESTSDTITGS
jgi:hypothetical protein